MYVQGKTLIYLYIIFATITAASFLIGYTARWAGSQLHKYNYVYSSSQLAQAIFAAVILSYFTLSIFSNIIPTLNDPVFSITNSAKLSKREASIQLQFRCKNIKLPIGSIQECRNFPTKVNRKIAIEIKFPQNVPVNKDFTITAVAKSTPNFPGGLYTAKLLKPKYIGARTSDACDGEQVTEGVVSNACRTISSSDQLDFRWTLTPTQTGQAEISIKTSAIDFVGATSANTDGAISLSYDGKNGQINSEKPTLDLGNLQLDGPRGEVRFPIEVLTTVGVNQATYDLLKIAGAVVSALAALLGAGFLLRFNGIDSKE